MPELDPLQTFCGYNLDLAYAESAGRLAVQLPPPARMSHPLAGIVGYYFSQEEPVPLGDAESLLTDFNTQIVCILRPSDKSNLEVNVQMHLCRFRFNVDFASTQPERDGRLPYAETAILPASSSNHHIVFREDISAN